MIFVIVLQHTEHDTILSFESRLLNPSTVWFTRPILSLLCQITKKQNWTHLGYDVFTAVVMNSSTFLGYIAEQSVEIQPMIRRKISPLTSGLKGKRRKKAGRKKKGFACCPPDMFTFKGLHSLIFQTTYPFTINTFWMKGNQHADIFFSTKTW
jgi:hypothetical protein